MNPLRIICLFMGIFTLASANYGPRSQKMHYSENSVSNDIRVSDMISMAELESLPSMQELTIEKLEEMNVHEGADYIRKLYHLSQAGRSIEASYIPKISEIPVYYYNGDKTKVSLKLNELIKVAMEDKSFGIQEVTIYITGLPEQTDTIKKATHSLVHAYMQRYYGQMPRPYNFKFDDNNSEKGDSRQSEEASDSNYNKMPAGTLVVIELGQVLNNFKKYAVLDVEKTGMQIGDVLVQLTDKMNIPHEIVHVIGSNIGAHVAGAVGRQFVRKTGHKLRRITGLDPSKIFAQTDKALKGLARGDADFVDVIHTSAYGMGIPTRSGDVDFYPNGPSEGVPGADNVIEASMRAVRYYAESVVPGNEHNFPAVGATSLQQYKEHNGNGKRVYMGIYTDYDIQGDYMLQVNAKSPFGRRSRAQKQLGYHNVHMPWKMYSYGI